MPTDRDDSPFWPADVNSDPVERQIREAIERGEFDALPGAGKPLPDIDQQYDPAWWARRWVQRARREDTADELRRLVRSETPRLRAAADREAARARAEEINNAVRQVNETLDPADRIPIIEI